MWNLTLLRHGSLNDRVVAYFNCTSIDQFVGNLTASYTDTSNEASMVSASVIMFVLAGLFFNLNLFSRFSDVSAILDPKVRFFLTSGLSLFLPVMSYLFSEAKNAAAITASLQAQPDLSLRAGVILVWMLLVELIRKKVDEVRMRGYSGTVQRAGRVVWLGSLVFFNIHGVGRKAVFGILWVLCATKVLQRVAFTEVGKRSFAYGKNARLVSSYMSQMLSAGQRHEAPTHAGAGGQREVLSPLSTHDDIEQVLVIERPSAGGDALLTRSKVLVMGEEDLVIEPTADGYKLKEITDGYNDDTMVVTVGKVWGHVTAVRFDQCQRLKRLCLSFALFKLLRQRFEHLPPVTKEETHECRDIIFKGVYNDREENAEAVFETMNNEVNFLCEYYHSVIPVVLASPFFFVANYFLLPIVVLALCAMTVVLCGDGDAIYAFTHIREENFAISHGVINTTMCLLVKAFHSPPAFFTAVDFFITFLLIVILCYEEVWEFIVFLFSNWFMVSLLCTYVARPSPTFTGIVRRILCVRAKMSHPVLCFKQFTLLGLRWPVLLGMPSMFSLMLPAEAVPNKAKHFIIESLLAHSGHDVNGGAGVPLSNGVSKLVGHRWRESLLPACKSESIAEVMLTWHVATTIMEAKCPPGDSKKIQGFHTVATRLSRYCAYLVAFHPELLPDNQEKSERVFDAAKEELKGTLGCCVYYLSCWRTRVDSVVAVAAAGAEWKDGMVVHNGAKLGNMLRVEATRSTRKLGNMLGGEAMRKDDDGQLETTWKLLADVWTELLVYVAPSSDEERVMGHESVLVQGGEFITVLWALSTHVGIARPE